MKKIILLFCLFFTFVTFSYASYIEKFPVEINQPDGTIVQCFVSGDEFYNWVHDAEGYTLIRDPQTSYVVYAKLQDGELVSTGYVFGTIDPATIGLTPWTIISAEKREQARREFLNKTPGSSKIYESKGVADNITLNNIVIFIRFADEDDFESSYDYYYDMFNNETEDYPSMYSYFNAVSKGSTLIPSTFCPPPEGNLILSYQDSYPRSYYQPYDAIMNPNGYTGGDNGYERTEREHQLLANAIVAVENTIPENLNIDYNNDGDVDNICFIVKGSPGEWNTLLWPHKWALYSYDVEIHGKFVWEYNMQIETHLDNSKASVLSHEMFHSLGAPDYYHYSHDGLTPVGQWDLMAGNTLPPQSPLAYTKWKYGGWIDDIPTITVDGTYTLNNVWADENCAYKILSPNSSSEYFVIEFRDTDIFWDSSIPGTGVLIYRINSNENGNSQGPPDEVYIYRPGGDLYNDGDIYLAHYGVDDRTEISDDTSPSCFLSYGGQGGIHIYNITINDNGTASFTIGEAAANDATLSALSISDGSLTPQFSPNITEYMVSVGNSVNNITITAIANNPLASVSGDGTHPLNIGENPFDIIVTAEDGETTKTYTVNVNRSDIIYYDIISSVDGTNGIIDPLGNNSYIEGSDVTYTMTPDNGYIIDKVLIDNNEVVITDNTYTFEDISSNHSIVVKFKLFVGIEDFTNQIKIYPNPAKNNVTIESSEEINNITIFDSFGKKIFERGNINEKSLMIDVNNYSVGIYYITVDGKTEKLIVK